MADHLWGFYPGTYDRLWAAKRELKAANDNLEALYRLQKDSQASSAADCKRQVSSEAIQQWIREANNRKERAKAKISICEDEIQRGRVQASYQEFR